MVKPSAATFGSLSDIKIIDLTQMLAGPYGTMMLADHGAQVIKVEPPQGDMTRAAGPFRPDDPHKVLGGYLVCLPKSGPVFELVPAPIMELRHGQESQA